MTFPTQRYVSLMALAGLAAAVCLGIWPPPVQGASPAAAAAKPAVAILEPEIVADLTAAERQALAGSLDTLLTTSLAEKQNFTIIDRLLLDKVLAERTAKVGGFSKVDPSEIQESLRPFWTAGVLICPMVTRENSAKDSTTVPPVTISIEAVSAQTGQLLAEVQVAGQWKEGRWSEAPQLDEPLKGFWKTLSRNVEAACHQRLVEIPDGRLVSRMTRLQWLVDSLGDSLRAGVAAQPGLTLLTPRHPVSTKEERLLRAMGLAAVNPEDPSAGLAAAPDVRVGLELTEEVGKDLEYEKTPITIKLSVQTNGRAATSESFTGLAAGHEALRAKAESWLAEQLRGQADPAAPVGDDEYCRKLAQEELAAAWSLRNLGRPVHVSTRGLGIVREIDYGFWIAPFNRPEEQARQAKALGRALRAAHLDPTCEEAARLVALWIGSEYSRTRPFRNVSCADRVMAEGQRYLERFPNAPEDARAAVRLNTASAAFGHLEQMRPGGLWLDQPYNPDIYRYAKVALLTFSDKLSRPRADSGWANSIWLCTNEISEAIFIHCPADCLEAEHTYWHDYWSKNVEPLSGQFDLPPWKFVELGYLVRKQDWKLLRNSLTALAEKYPLSSTSVWGGNGAVTGPWQKMGGVGNPSQPMWKVRLGLLLKLAGDSEWSTWAPAFKESVPRWDPRSYTDFLSRHNPAMGTIRRDEGPWSKKQEGAVPLPADALDLAWDDPEDAATARDKGFSPVLSAGGFVWLMLPGPSDDQRMANRLFVVPLAALLKPGVNEPIRPLRLVWPEEKEKKDNAPLGHPINCWTASLEGGAAVVWVGTADHGLARFDLQDGRWRGRWYTVANGLPGEDILQVATCRYAGQHRLLVLGRARATSATARGIEKFLWAMDADGGQISMILNDKVSWGSHATLLATWTDGTKIPLNLYNDTDFPKDDAQGIVKLSFEYYFPAPCLTRDGEIRKVWRSSAVGLQELVVDERLRPRSGQADLSALRDQLIFEVPRDQHLLRLFPAHYTRWTLLRAPPFDLMCCTSGPPTFWGTVGLWASESGEPIVGDNRFLLAYRSGGKEPTDENDCWLGPWQMPAKSFVRTVSSLEGRLWVVTTDGRLLRVDPETAVRAAEAAHAACSSAVWRKDYYARLAAEPWPTPVRVNLTLRNWEAALAAVESQRQIMPGTDLALWEALIRARKGEYDQADRLYQQLVEDDKVETCAKALALVNLINVRHALGQWSKLLEAADQLVRLCPELTNKRPGGGGGSREDIQWYIKDAQKHLEAEQSSSSSSATKPAEKAEKQGEESR